MTIDETTTNETTDETTTETTTDHITDEATDSEFNYSFPLPETIRPKSLDDYIGQEHLMGPNGQIHDFIRLKYLPSMVLHGPPGVGKTTLASILAKETGYVFVELNATDATISDLKQLSNTIERENIKRESSSSDHLSVVVFIDEIHRFSIKQQDFLLPLIETGQFVFIGATTINPKVKIRRAILSRCQVFELKKLQESNLYQILDKAIVYENIRRRKVFKLNFMTFSETLKSKLIEYCKGDSRKLISSVQFISLNHQSVDLEYKGVYTPVVLDTDVLDLLDFKPKVNVNGIYRQLFDGIKSCDFQGGKTGKRLAAKKKDIGTMKQNEKEVSTKTKDLVDVHMSPVSMVVRINYDKTKSTGKADDFSDNFFGNEKRYILPTDTLTEYTYASHMEFSEGEEEIGGVLSDTESDYEPITQSSVKSGVVDCISIGLRILQHESPIQFIRNLLLFALSDVDNYTLLPKIIALVKCLSKVNINVTKGFSNLLEKLCKCKKLQYTNTNKFKMEVIKSFLGHDTAVEEDTEVEVSYDQQLIDSLLIPPVFDPPIDRLGSLQVEPWTEGLFVGDPLGDGEDDLLSDSTDSTDITDSDNEYGSESTLSPISSQIMDTYDYSDGSFILLSDAGSPASSE